VETGDREGVFLAARCFFHMNCSLLSLINLACLKFMVPEPFTYIPSAIVRSRPLHHLVRVLELESPFHSPIHIFVISTYAKVVSHPGLPVLLSPKLQRFLPPPHLSHQHVRSYLNIILINRTNPKIYFSRTPL